MCASWKVEVMSFWATRCACGIMAAFNLSRKLTDFFSTDNETFREDDTAIEIYYVVEFGHCKYFRKVISEYEIWYSSRRKSRRKLKLKKKTDSFNFFPFKLINNWIKKI